MLNLLHLKRSANVLVFFCQGTAKCQQENPESGKHEECQTLHQLSSVSTFASSCCQSLTTYWSHLTCDCIVKVEFSMFDNTHRSLVDASGSIQDREGESPAPRSKSNRVSQHSVKCLMQAFDHQPKHRSGKSKPSKGLDTKTKQRKAIIARKKKHAGNDGIFKVL